MDSTTLVALAGFGGGIVGGGIALIGQIIMQRGETRRAMQRLAYEAGMKEWEINHAGIERARQKGISIKLAPPEDAIALHLFWTKTFDEMVAHGLNAEKFAEAERRYRTFRNALRDLRYDLAPEEAKRMGEEFGKTLGEEAQALWERSQE